MARTMLGNMNTHLWLPDEIPQRDYQPQIGDKHNAGRDPNLSQDPTASSNKRQGRGVTLWYI